jgi:M6 family metalloprotease-like protein
MKNIARLFTGLTLSLLTLPAVFAQHTNCSVAPYENTLTQPDGSEITLTALGTEAIHYLETKDGFTVLKNAAGFFEYATTDHAGNLVSSGITARDGQSFKNGVPHLRYSGAQRDLLLQVFEQAHAHETEALGKAAGVANPFPPNGKRKLLVLLVEYPDLRATLPKENFELLLNQPNYNGTGSFRDFYLATSNGMLDVESTVYGWVMADSNYTYYGKESSPNYNIATRQLLLGALSDANDSFNIDYSEFDSDEDGFVDGVIIMHAGRGAEESSAPGSGNFIWSFRSTLSSSQQPTYDNVKVSAYAMFPEKRYRASGDIMVGIGVMCHEFGHLLDLPDLYDVNYFSAGVGNYSLMGGGPWLNEERTPCLNDAWSRIQLGWVTPVLLTGEGTQTLPYAVADSDMVFRINTSRTNEYFLLENRQRKGFDTYLPSDGFAIWHINTNRAQLLSLASTFRNQVNTDTSQFGVGLMQADGARHLERNIGRGDEFDLYPITNKNMFTPESTPSSALHYKVGGVKQPSNVSITNIVQNPDSSITFGFGAKTAASFSPSRTSGCTPLSVTFNNSSFGADSSFWDFGNGGTSNLEKPQYSFTDSGSYTVKLIIYKEGVAADSITAKINVFPTPVPDYEYKRSDTGYVVKFTNKSKSADTYQWLFNDSLSTSDPNPSITMSGPGTIKVKLNAYNSQGCLKISEEMITIYSLGLKGNAAEQMQLNTYPNPFANTMSVDFYLDHPVSATIEMFNILGDKVTEMQTENLTSGNHSIKLNTANLSNGIYLLKVTAGDRQGWLKAVKK